jgi:Flp pilus assembly protein TadG
MALSGQLKGLMSGASWRRLQKDETGATAVEFAMVAPLFFLMLGVILETGLMMFTEYVLQTSVQEAGRKVRTGQAQEKAMSASDFRKEICDLAGIIIDCGKINVDMRAMPNFTALAATTPSATNIGPKDDGTVVPTSFQCGRPMQAVSLIATYDWDFSIPYFMSFFGNRKGDTSRRLAGYAMFRNEPFPSTTASCT